MVSGLLEGAAFLAARVQLKLKHEFPEFTNNLLEQLVPHYLAPTPSAMIVQVDPDLRRQVASRGSRRPARLLSRRLVSRARPADRLPLSVEQRHRRLAVRIVRRRIFLLAGAARRARLAGRERDSRGHAADVDASNDGARGRRANRSRSAQEARDVVRSCRTAELPLYFAGSEADSIALYEQLFAHCKGIYFRFLDEFGDPVVYPASAGVPSAGRIRARRRAVPERYAGFRGIRSCCANSSCFRENSSAAS